MPVNRVAAKVVTSTDKPTLQGFVVEHTVPGASVYSDEASAYEGIPFDAIKQAVDIDVGRFNKLAPDKRLGRNFLTRTEWFICRDLPRRSRYRTPRASGKNGPDYPRS